MKHLPFNLLRSAKAAWCSFEMSRLQPSSHVCPLSSLRKSPADCILLELNIPFIDFLPFLFRSIFVKRTFAHACVAPAREVTFENLNQTSCSVIIDCTLRFHTHTHRRPRVSFLPPQRNVTYHQPLLHRSSLPRVLTCSTEYASHKNCPPYCLVLSLCSVNLD